MRRAIRASEGQEQECVDELAPSVQRLLVARGAASRQALGDFVVPDRIQRA